MNILAFYCDNCGNRLQQGQNSYNQTNRTTGEIKHLCGGCFKTETGVSPNTYFGRKYGAYIAIAGSILTIYLFIKVGFWAGITTAIIIYYLAKFMSNM